MGAAGERARRFGSELVDAALVRLALGVVLLLWVIGRATRQGTRAR